MRTRRFCFVLLVAGILAAACASSAATSAPYPGFKQDFATPAPAFTVSTQGGGPAPAASSAPGAELGGAQASGATSGGSFNAPGPENQIVKTGTISIQVAAIDDSVTQATAQIHAIGGWLAASDRTSSRAEDMASVTYRIPVDRFEDALALMRRLGTKILSEHTESTPVGAEIVDLQARIANLKASEKAIQAIMLKANTIGDVLTVQQRLAEVQGQIEQLSGQLAGLTDQAAYSTLSVVFVVPIKPTPSPSASPTPSPSATETPIPWSAGDQAGQAAGTLGEVGKAAGTVLIWLAIVVLPVTIALVFLLALLGLLARLLDPYRKRLLPFTVGQEVDFARPAWPGPGGQFTPTRPAPGAAPGTAPNTPEGTPKT